MKRLGETLAFLALALGVHLLMAMRFEREDGADAGGQDGAAMVTIAAASASLETMVAEWEHPPEVVEVAQRPVPPEPTVQAPPPALAVQPDLPPELGAPIALPSAPRAAEERPQIDLATPRPPEPEPEPEPEPVAETPPPPEPQPEPVAEPAAEPEPRRMVELDPEGRPTRTPRPPEMPAGLEPPDPPREVAEPTPAARPAAQQRPASAASQAQKAAGSGGTQQAGTSGSSTVKTLGRAQEAQLMSVWGARIRSRIERQKRFPRGARGSGRVVVRITVMRDGRISGAGIARSSGNPAFDQAAMTAISRTGRVPAAPDELTQASYAFNLPMDFK